MTPAEIPTQSESTAASERQVFSDVTCLGCGCLCDDLTVEVEKSEIRKAHSACEIGRNWFLAHETIETVDEARVEGQPVARGEAIERAVEILAGSKSLVVCGLTQTTIETVRAALALADRLGARVILDRSETELGRVAAFQDQGKITATLGEVKNRADLVVFWGVDPLATHPRHWERYSVEPKGRFVTGGRAARTVVVVDEKVTQSAQQADQFFRVAPQHNIEAITSLRMILQGKSVAIKSNRDFDIDGLRELANRCKAARYGVIFFQAKRESGGPAGLGWWEATRLVRDLNERTRFVLLGMGGAGNLAGAEAALVWQSGFLQGVDYRSGRPSPIRDETTIEECLKHGEADAVLAVASALPVGLSVEARAHLGSIPTVLIGPGATHPAKVPATVALATSTTGIDASGTVMRTDGLTLPPRPLRRSPFPDDRDLLAIFLENVGGRGQS